MIRIDEIYCNTFLPRIQGNINHGLHWFDPFGSVDFKDLCNVPAVTNKKDTVRYLFWDQEPLHVRNVDKTLQQFVDMFCHGKRHLITSERNSEFVDYACDTYGFESHYYFFHGWASLDWFRGYNRSFLIAPAGQRHINKTFLAPNRIVAGQREHRLLILYHMFKNKLNNNWISCPGTCPAENIAVTQAVKSLSVIYPDIELIFEEADLPRSFPGEQDSPMHSYCLSLFDQAAESLLYVVTETVAKGRRQHLTEKTFKPICLQMPFVLVAPAGSLEYLRRYGFRTFGHIWDESYDQETDTVKRIEAVSVLLTQLDGMNTKEKNDLYHAARDTVMHNYNLFYSGEFEKILWLELQQMLEDLDV